MIADPHPRAEFQNVLQNKNQRVIQTGDGTTNCILMFSCFDWLLHGDSCVSIAMIIWGTDITENIAILLL